MAVHTKTIEYVFVSRNTSLAAATRYDFTAITLYVPETTSRTFRSVRVQVTCRDNQTTAVTLTSPVVGIKLGATAFSDTTLGNPSANSGEHQSYIFERDVTSYFVTNFGAGASQTCQVGVQFSGAPTINITAKVIITYECEDQQTRVKTVRIPLESGAGALTATLTEIGTNQIPNLSTFLPESSKTIRQVWFELEYNEFTVGTVNDAQLGMQVNTETEHLTGLHESALASSLNDKYIWEQTTATWVTSGAVAAFKLRSSNITTASTFNHVGIILCVTYEYDHTNSTTILNSLVLGMHSMSMPGISTDDHAALAMDLLITEPATITMVQSGALVYYHSIGNNQVTIQLGAQSTRSYTEAALLFCGQSALTQRIDSGSAAGSAITLARGNNKMYWFISGAIWGAQTGFYGYLFLNYTSGKASGGDGNHNRSTCWSVGDSIAAASNRIISAAQFINIAETEWYNNDLSAVVNSAVSAVTVVPFTLHAESASGEISSGGLDVVSEAFTITETENGILHQIVRMNHLFDRWYNDPQTWRMNVEGSRRFRASQGGASGTMPIMFWLTYHSISKTVGGSISGSGGGTVTIHTIRDVDGQREEVSKTTRTGNGAFSTLVYDDVENYKAIAREDATHLGSSERATGT